MCTRAHAQYHAQIRITTRLLIHLFPPTLFFPIGWLNVSARSEVAAQENSGLACCNLQSALQEALKLADNAMDFSAFDSNNDGAVDLVTVCSPSLSSA